MFWKRLRGFALFDYLLVLGMAVMSLLVFANVILRFAFNSGLPFSVEVSRLAFIWVVFIGSIVALKDGSHLAVDAIVKRLPRTLAFSCFFITHSIMLWCCWLLWQGSWIQTKVNLSNFAPISGISLGSMYAAGLVAALAFAVIILVRVVRALGGVLPHDLQPEAGADDAIADADESVSRDNLRRGDV